MPYQPLVSFDWESSTWCTRETITPKLVEVGGVELATSENGNYQTRQTVIP